MKYLLIKNTTRQGFILPFTMLISALVLFIVAGSMALLSKQLYFSKVYKQSQIAYYAADDAVACAVSIDDTYLGSDGIGIFPSNQSGATEYIGGVLDYFNERRRDQSLTEVNSINDIECAQSKIFDSAQTGFTVLGPYSYVSPANGIEIGASVSYDMKMDLGDGTYRCAKITVNKTQSFRQIIAQGYSQCGSSSGSVERAVVNTTISE